jgi:hypothetical protein
MQDAIVETGSRRVGWLPTRPAAGLPTGLASWLPAGLAGALAAIGFITDIRWGSTLWWSLIGTAGAILVWNAIVVAVRKPPLSLTLVLRKQHYLQACAQGAVLVYWGWYWPPVAEAVSLLAAQLVFAYAFDMLLAWSRRDTYTLGFGPFPVVFSVNLFLWFKPEWFFLQFAMLAVGFTAKELVRWTRDGKSVHIFNPSSFPLAVFSLGLILAGASDITRGQDIAVSQFYPPHMYLWLFLVGLPGQFFFGVASMTLSAVLTTYLLGLLYFAAAGTYFFYDSYVPIAVFLGMHLLFTDPSTAPRTELGRLVFGALYGASSMLLYAALGALGVPAFYDKLLQVPILNLSVRGLDRAARSSWLQSFDPARLGRALTLRQRHVAYMTTWATAFAVLSGVQGLGDRHPGQWLPFWDRACQEGSARACAYLTTLEQILCDAGSGWACNESGVRIHGSVAGSPADAATGQARAAQESFEQGCRLGFIAACQNARRQPGDDRGWLRAEPRPADYRVLVRGSKGPVPALTPVELRAKACEQGWPDACGQIRE